MSLGLVFGVAGCEEGTNGSQSTNQATSAAIATAGATPPIVERLQEEPDRFFTLVSNANQFPDDFFDAEQVPDRAFVFAQGDFPDDYFGNQQNIETQVFDLSQAIAPLPTFDAEQVPDTTTLVVFDVEYFPDKVFDTEQFPDDYFIAAPPETVFPDDFFDAQQFPDDYFIVTTNPNVFPDDFFDEGEFADRSFIIVPQRDNFISEDAWPPDWEAIPR